MSYTLNKSQWWKGFLGGGGRGGSKFLTIADKKFAGL
jgi:hypothetical protein